MALSLTLGAPALAQMGHARMDHPMQGGTTVTRTVDQPDGTRTVVRHEVGNPGNAGWHRHHRQCVAHWHHHQRVTSCWSL